MRQCRTESDNSRLRHRHAKSHEPQDLAQFFATGFRGISFATFATLFPSRVLARVLARVFGASVRWF